MPRLEIGFDDLPRMSRWISRAMTRGLLPEVAAAFETDVDRYVLTDVREAVPAGANELPIDRPDPLTQIDVTDQRQAIVWLMLTLLSEDDSRLALEESNIDPDSIELSGSDVVMRTTAGVPFLLQALPLTSPS